MSLSQVKIGDYCSVGDGAHASLKRVDTGIPYLTAKNIKGGCISDENIGFIDESTFNKHFKIESKAISRPKSGDVIFGIIGSLGQAYLVKSYDRFGISSSVAVLRPDSEKVFPRFLYYWLTGPTFQSALYSIKGGVAQSYISLEMIRSLPLVVPDLATQRRIASILSAYDYLIENNTRRIAIFEDMARRIYEEWFVRFRFPGHEEVQMVESELGLIPGGWQVSRVGDAFTTVLGGTPSRNKPEFWESGTVPWINSGKVNELRIHEPSELITEHALKKSATKLMPEGTTLLAITGATLGQVSILSRAMCANQSVVGIIDPNDSRSEYIYRTIQSRITEIIQHASGGAQQHINKEVVNNVIVVIPDHDTLFAFNNAIVPLGKLISSLMKRNIVLRKTRDLLLPKLISGELDVSTLPEPGSISA